MTCRELPFYNRTKRGEELVELERFEGCWTALVTPFTPSGELDLRGLRRNVLYQIEGGAKLVPTGTTGESPTLEWEEQLRVIKEVVELAKGKGVPVMAGTGSNSTEEALKGTRGAAELGVEAVLLVDCYYNAPSTWELRTGYYEVIAGEFPSLFVTLYIIPGRSGTQLEVEDLAILHRKYRNVRSVKEATGDLERMAKTRRLLGEDFDILSGDDGLTFEMMTRSDIRAQGVVSVISNLLPGAVREMVEALAKGEIERGRALHEALSPLFDVVTVKTEEEYDGFKVPCKFRNPTPIKTIMRGLGLPAGPCRSPLGKMGPKGVAKVREAVKEAFERKREIFLPLEDFYGIKVEERLSRDEYWS